MNNPLDKSIWKKLPEYQQQNIGKILANTEGSPEEREYTKLLWMGKYRRLQRNIEDTFYLFDRCKEVARDCPEPEVLNKIIDGELGRTYLDTGDLAKSDAYLTSAVRYFVDNKRFYPSTVIFIGNLILCKNLEGDYQSVHRLIKDCRLVIKTLTKEQKKEAIENAPVTVDADVIKFLFRIASPSLFLLTGASWIWLRLPKRTRKKDVFDNSMLAYRLKSNISEIGEGAVYNIGVDMGWGVLRILKYRLWSVSSLSFASGLKTPLKYCKVLTNIGDQFGMFAEKSCYDGRYMFPLESNLFGQDFFNMYASAYILSLYTAVYYALTSKKIKKPFIRLRMFVWRLHATKDRNPMVEASYYFWRWVLKGQTQDLISAAEALQKYSSEIVQNDGHIALTDVWLDLEREAESILKENRARYDELYEEALKVKIKAQEAWRGDRGVSMWKEEQYIGVSASAAMLLDMVPGEKEPLYHKDAAYWLYHKAMMTNTNSSLGTYIRMTCFKLFALKGMQEDSNFVERYHADVYLDSAVSMVASLYEDFRDDYLSREFLSDHYEMFSDRIKTASELGTELAIKDAFKVTEEIQARNLLDMQSGHLNPAPSMPPDLREKYKAISEALDTEVAELFEKRDLLQNGMTKKLKKDEARLDRSVKIRRSQMSELVREGQIRNQDNQLARAKIATMEEVAEALKPRKAVMIKWHIGYDQITIIGLDYNQETVIEKVSITGDKLDELVYNFQSELPLDGRAMHSPIYLNKLYQKLIHPVEDFIGQYERVVAVPTGSIVHVPIPALRNRDGYLGERHVITLALSGSSFVKCCDTEHIRSGKYLVVGDPIYRGKPWLPKRQLLDEETDAVARILGVVAFKDEQATKEIFLKYIEEIEIGHFGVHGEHVPDFPLDSALYFAGNIPLTAREILDIKLKAWLIVCSACDTLKFKVLLGDEMLGLTSSLLAVGAINVISSLWPVNHGTTRVLMEMFFTSLKETDGDIAKSLQTAQKRIRENTTADWSNPFFWAPFQVVGRGF